MSRTKELFNWVWRAMTEYGMLDSPHDEVIAFATGLRDGEEEVADSSNNPYSRSDLNGFYKQGFKHGSEGVDGHGYKI